MPRTANRPQTEPILPPMVRSFSSFEDMVRAIVREEIQTAKQEILQVIRRQQREPNAEHLPASPLGEYLSTKHAARVADVSEPTVRRWIGQGMLPAHRRGRLVRIRLDELRAVLAQSAKRPVDLDARARQILARSLRSSK